MPIISLLKAQPGVSRSEFGAQVLQSLDSNQSRVLPEAKRIFVIVPIEEPIELARNGVIGQPPCDVVLIIDGVDLASHEGAMQRFLPQWAGATRHTYLTEAVPKKDKRNITFGNPSQGFRMIHPLFFHEDLPASALRRSWGELHAELARKIHVGVGLYLQQYVQRVVTDSSPNYGGFADHHFPSWDDLIHGYFESPRGRDEIRHDIRHFIKDFPPRFFGVEHRIRDELAA